MIWKFCWTSAGDRPIDGSSISSSRGARHQRAAHRDHLLLAARQRAGELAAPFVAAAGTARGPGRSPRRATRRGAAPRRARGSPGPSSARTGAGSPARSRSRSAMRCGTGHCVTSWPSSRTRPERGRTMPRMVFSVVDLPDALPPSRQTSSPSSHVQRDPLQDPHLAVVRGDLVQAQQRRAHPASASASGSRPM